MQTKQTNNQQSKTIVPIVLFLLSILLSIIFASCKKDSVSSSTTVPSGSWAISYYFDNSDETSNYAGYSFTFSTGGQATAVKSGMTVNGTWSESSTEFTLDFGSSDVALKELNHSWLKTEKTATSIKLKDDNPAQNDKVYFVKN